MVRRAIILVFLCVGHAALAKTARVEYDSTSYEIKVAIDHIEYIGRDFSKKVSRQKCNRSSIDQFKKNWDRQTASLVTIRKIDSLKGVIRVSLDGHKRFALRHGESGRYFAALPSKFKNLWLTSERLCAK